MACSEWRESLPSSSQHVEKRERTERRERSFSVEQRRRKLERVNKRRVNYTTACWARSFFSVARVVVKLVYCLAVSSGWQTWCGFLPSWRRLRCWRLLPTSCSVLLEWGVSCTSSDWFRLHRCAAKDLFLWRVCATSTVSPSAPAVANTCFWFRLISWSEFTVGTRLSSTPPRGGCGVSCSLSPLSSPSFGG